MNRTFSPAGYADILAAARDRGYAIRPLRDAFRTSQVPVLLLRHDVDLSLRLALEMAEFESARGITATYHILPHNDFHAPFSPEGRRMLVRMAELGHEIGLHCDADVYPKESGEFVRAVRRDIETLEEITGRKVFSASQHRPAGTPFDLGGLVDIEAYAPLMRERFSYLSDSAMCWRTTPWDLLPSGRNMQLLIHPIWWMAPGNDRKEKFQYVKAQTSERDAAKLDAELAFIEQCLADRKRLDARVVQQWRGLAIS